jgi:hypothetical protein
MSVFCGYRYLRIPDSQGEGIRDWKEARDQEGEVGGRVVEDGKEEEGVGWEGQGRGVCFICSGGIESSVGTIFGPHESAQI